MTDQSQEAVLEPERRRFESWAKADGYTMFSRVPDEDHYQRKRRGHYQDYTVDLAWSAWKAATSNRRAALTPTQGDDHVSLPDEPARPGRDNAAGSAAHSQSAVLEAPAGLWSLASPVSEGEAGALVAEARNWLSRPVSFDQQCALVKNLADALSTAQAENARLRASPWQPMDTAPRELDEATRVPAERTGLTYDLCMGTPIIVLATSFDFPGEDADPIKACWSLGPHGGLWWDLEAEEPLDRELIGWVPFPALLSNSEGGRP
jgi:hypothetical protein